MVIFDQFCFVNSLTMEVRNGWAITLPKGTYDIDRSSRHDSDEGVAGNDGTSWA